MPAGISAEVPELQDTIRLAPGDLVLTYSDGVTEACNPAGEEFGEARLLNVAMTKRGLDAVPLCNMILDAVKYFTSGDHQADDLTVLAAQSVPRG